MPKPAKPTTIAPSGDIQRLIEIMAALRTPVTGCPWDLEQSFATIARYTIEEAYEVADAIERQDLVDLKDELGDLLLQVVYHARLAEEEAAFAFPDVVRAITTKMIRRHPHVFGDEHARTAGMAKGAWERIKAAEKAEKLQAKGGAAKVAPPSLLADVPQGLPALTRAVKLQDKAARVGFDWPSLAPVFEKMREEIEELAEVAIAADPRAAVSPAPDAAAQARISEEYGDLLFVMANVARHLQVDPETALRAANAKFARRFAHIEARLAAQDRSPSQSDLAEMDSLWNEAKAGEKRQS
ncbi:MAG: nucleoside triphosphate pyrophosphohydrolase [Hyphomicrobiaceae bacterium]